ncbi:uncharacterized protein E0L32_008681 [Thyridium curvatum]|uniref:Major facilitator superfamily (MFS) profile domain-containing protein n=1 Tax=Thyridium curvatum TaxID=1093900 RepID=A0A507AU91_9PEZI|nr:uncharacterized protein E0L32_008681 [Thyridium curvatum]TPX10276.1 hypothetical protein E0L32_008681 [Thyridium curvatum]
MAHLHLVSAPARYQADEAMVGDNISIDIPGLPDDPDSGLTVAEKAALDRKLLWKLDLMLLPWLCFLYLICFLDRTNIGNAKIAHLTKDVHMSTTQYNLTLTVFFISYAAFEAIANVLIKRFRPSVVLPIIMALWGLCMLSMGFVHNWSGLMAARWFLGVTESGLFPGVNYYLSCWYRRSELALRAAIFFSAAALSGSFGGLLAAAIENLDSKGGKPGWAWIFIIEGAITVIVGLVSFWMVHDFPDEVKFLSEDDRARVLRRLTLDQQHSATREDFKIMYLWQALKDWKTYAGMLLYMGPLMPLYSFSLFLPTIIANLGFTTSTSIVKNQLLSVPPYAVAAVATVAIGYLSDRQKKRGLYNIICAPVGILGFSMLLGSTNPSLQYAGTFFAATGIYPTIPITTAWISNNVDGVYKRGIVLGLVIGWGNLNGVVSSNVFFHPPRFVEGHATIIAYMTVCILGGSILMWILLTRENAKRRNGDRNHWVEGKTQEEIEEMGDRHPDFIFTT